MPDTGAPWNIPYVAGTDLVSDWPTDSQSLATAIADGLDAANLGIGSNVVQTVKTDTQVTSGVSAGGALDITGLTATITPTSATSKILLLAQVNAVMDSNGLYVGFQFVRDSTVIGKGDNAGNRVGMTAGGAIDSVAQNQANMTTHMTYLDSPATTSAITYKVQVRNASAGTRTVYVNRSITDPDTLADTWRSICSLTAIEVAA